MTHPEMTPDEVWRARQALGLTQAQLALMLGFSVAGNPSARISNAENGTPLSAARVRLLQLYLAGSRPPDWPK